MAAADAAVGVLLEGLRALGIGTPAIVVSADHGEGLGDHGEAEHGLLLYAEALRIPLLVARHAPEPRRSGFGRDRRSELYDVEGDPGEATNLNAAFGAELAIDPTNIQTRTALGSPYWSLGRDSDARGVITGIVTENPRAGDREHAAVIQALAVLGDDAGAAAWRQRAQRRSRQ